MKKMRLATKLILSFSIIVALDIGMGIFAITQLARVNRTAEDIGQNNLPSIMTLDKIAVGLSNYRRHELQHVLSDTHQEWAEYEKNMEKTLSEEIRKNESIFDPLATAEEEKVLWKEFKAGLESYLSEGRKILELSRQEKKQEAKTILRGDSLKQFDKAGEAIGKLVALNAGEVKDALNEGRAVYVSSRMWVIGLLAAVGVLGTLVSILLILGITRPIKRVIAGLAEGSEQVAASSTQVSSASRQLAEGASEQAAAIEQTSSSLEEMAAMTKQNSDNALHANRLMAEAGKTVEQANQSMMRLTTSMGEISKTSEETQKIIKTIDEIAFQTNLLALNAAVEAARAGEAGAGFAVVADEVRNLAMRAADAAKNTAAIIEGTVKRTKEGSELVEKTNNEFQEVASMVIKSGELIAEISAASQEQTLGIGQINKAVSEMDKVTQQNAAGAEEAASASGLMNSQAEDMKGFVRELVILVDGTDHHGAVESAKPMAGNRTTSKVIRKTPSPEASIRSGSGNPAGKANRLISNMRKEKRADTGRLIPFDGDDSEDF